MSDNHNTQSTQQIQQVNTSNTNDLTPLLTSTSSTSQLLPQSPIIREVFKECINSNIDGMKILIHNLKEQDNITIDINTTYCLPLINCQIKTTESTHSLLHAAILSNSSTMIDFVLS